MWTLSSSSLFVWQTFNSLLVLRVCIKFFVERLKEEEVFRQFCSETPSQPPGQPGDGRDDSGGRGEPGQRFDRFLSGLTSTISDLPTS